MIQNQFHLHVTIRINALKLSFYDDLAKLLEEQIYHLPIFNLIAADNVYINALIRSSHRYQYDSLIHLLMIQNSNN